MIVDEDYKINRFHLVQNVSKMAIKRDIQALDGILFLLMEAHSYTKKDGVYCEFSIEEIAEKLLTSVAVATVKIKRLEKMKMLTTIYTLKRDRQRLVTDNFSEAMSFGIRFMVNRKFKINVQDVIEGNL